VSGALLWQPVSASKEKLLASGAVEWDRFRRGAGKETIDPFFKFVGEMWRNLGLNFDGKDTGTPWSAACISFMVKNAGYTRFKAVPAHSVYINNGIKARIAENGDKLTLGSRVHTCDDNGNWIGIVYPVNGQDCGTGISLAKRKSYKGPRKSGWVFGKYITIVSG
jgi:hypothetical protein